MSPGTQLHFAPGLHSGVRRDAGRGGEHERKPRNLLRVIEVVGRVEYLLEVVDRQADPPPLGLQVRLGHC